MPVAKSNNESGDQVGSEIIGTTRRAFAFAVRRTKAQRRELTLQERLVRALNGALTRETTFFAVPNGEARLRDEEARLSARGVRGGMPDLIFVSKGRVFGLALKSEKASLSGAERAGQVMLRDAGMRIEVARSLGEAFELLREMGIPLRPKSQEQFGSPRQ